MNILFFKTSEETTVTVLILYGLSYNTQEEVLTLHNLDMLHYIKTTYLTEPLR